MPYLISTYHRDGTLTYWSVYRQVWVRRAQAMDLEDLLALAPKERERVERHFKKQEKVHG